MTDNQSAGSSQSLLTAAWPARVPQTRTTSTGSERAYVRFAALGDVTTCAQCDRVEGRRDWSRILAESIAGEHDVSFCNLATPGATIDDVLGDQLPEAVDHRPHMTSMIIGLADAMRSGWDAAEVREGLLRCADELAWRGTALLTVRFHDHSRVLGLSGTLARPMRRRIDQLNEIYDQIHLDYDSIRVDLAVEPAVYSGGFWAADRCHPSELGHGLLASRFAVQLNARGLDFACPASPSGSDAR